MDAISIPYLFRCPISQQVMKEPVTICTGITYDRESIERWFEEGNLSCPSTMQVLETLDLTPNHTLKRLIQAWCSSNSGIQGTHNISSSNPDEKEIEQVLLNIRNSSAHLGNLRTLADLAKRSERNMALIAASGGHSALLYILSRREIMCREEALAILASLPIHEAKEECMSALKSPTTIDMISWFLSKGSMDARLHAAQVLYGLLTADQNLKAVFRPDEETFQNLNLLLQDECQSAVKTALEVLLIISPVRRNRMRAVEAGVAVTLIEILSQANSKLTEKALSLLEILCQSAEGRASVCGHPLGIIVLVQKIARVSEVGTDAAIAALWQIIKKCKTPSVLKDMEEAGGHLKLSFMLQVGCRSSIRQRAKEILRAQRGKS
ncbi:hypothetical protein SUGI_0448820 [Cryptomeria japonica]|uniref:E3 ubiquitin-protein ligase PUB23 n=1 Tax=Cryptomeria japonica TaxID=3369 RepID=UPI0024089B28|nr:E3 ubiquitin-protein ligase PUB23 [Cryptomeria japonica]GLJ23694.1 hypothetical protein SUGI_0448820 [Cryptomeria japonica]